LHEFTLDAAATAENTLCERFYTIEDDGLAQDWTGETVWVNPPYSRQGPWCEKAATASDAIVVMLLRVATGVKWWNEWVVPFAEVHYLYPRITFGGAATAAPFDSAIAVYRNAEGVTEQGRDAVTSDRLAA